MEDNNINEMDILNEIIGGDNSSEVENNQQQISNDDVNGAQQEFVNTENNTNEEDNQEFDINSLDLSHLGITTNSNDNVVATTNSENDPMLEIMKRLDTLQNSNQNQNSNDNDVLNDEELAPLKELADKLLKAGLIPSGLSEEDRQLLKDAKEIKARFEQEESIKQEQAEFENKINALDTFSQNLEKTIPGYDSKFMQKVVGDIVSTHPETAEKILNNPMELLTLWQQVGQKAQPSTTKTNVISSNSKTTADTGNNIEDKIKNGTASEQEEAMWLLKSFQ